MAEVWRLKGETESVIMAAQDQAISTNYFKKKILKQDIESRCSRGEVPGKK
jgi:hypothetical protein